jgi:hypothetical protein
MYSTRMAGPEVRTGRSEEGRAGCSNRTRVCYVWSRPYSRLNASKLDERAGARGFMSGRLWQERESAVEGGARTQGRAEFGARNEECEAASKGPACMRRGAGRSLWLSVFAVLAVVLNNLYSHRQQMGKRLDMAESRIQPEKCRRGSWSGGSFNGVASTSTKVLVGLPLIAFPEILGC